jgi:phospholipid/cholesterol/gamma-HCH transport system permease protein
MTSPVASMTAYQEAGATRLAFTGRLDAEGTGAIWNATMHAAAAAHDGKLVLDLGAVAVCDMAGAAFLLATEEAYGAAPGFAGETKAMQALIERARAARVPEPKPPDRRKFDPLALIALGGRAAAEGIAFLGEAVLAAISLPSRRRMLRIKDILRYADQAGVRALPLILLLGYLIGLILAFQSAVPMRRFGADLYVPNLVAISLLRELGPLLAAVILSGRTGSAFAAEIGTMKVNEEVDALVTMGFDPMTMLVLPRMIAVMLVMPAMTIVLELAGLAGMTTVMVGFGYPTATIATQVQSAATAGDLYGGLFKAVCFGLAVAAVGCRAGLGTGVGPRAVGLSATAAVVGGIVATIFLDGLFALIFYRLDL